MKRLLVAAIVVLSSANAFAWGDTGHTIVNECATLTLPADMPQFFLRSFPELTYLGPEPDRIKRAGDSEDAVNLPDHQIDYEYADGIEPLPRSRYEFMDAMEKNGNYRRHGLNHDDPGYLPWRIAEGSQYLQKLFGMWRFADRSDRPAIEREIVTVAGLLGHFVGDASNPHHTTTNYNGWVDANPNGYANDCEIHARFESTFVSHAVVRDDVTPRVAEPQLRTDYFAAGLELIMDSHSLVEKLYQIDKANGFDITLPVQPEAKAFAVSRLAKSSGLLRDLWWSAWVNSAPPVKR